MVFFLNHDAAYFEGHEGDSLILTRLSEDI
jgi:hypothetical protein